MGQIDPLAGFPIAATKSVEDAEAFITRSLTSARMMRIDDRHRFHLRMNSVNLGHTSLVFNRFGTGCEVTALRDDMLAFVVGGQAPSTFDFDGGSFVSSPRKAAVITPAGKMKIRRTAGSEILVLRTNYSDLLRHFEELTGRHHTGPLVFDHSVDLTNGPGAILKRMIDYLVAELEHNDLVTDNFGLRKSYDHMLLTALLSLPHNLREELYGDRPYKVAPGFVHRAEEYMRAHLENPVSIVDLLRICGCSRSMLFSAFRSARGYTPMEFLTEQRLQGARERMRKPLPEASVSSIALECGFTSLGRFSQVYRKRFGEHPSGTLRRGRRKE